MCAYDGTIFRIRFYDTDHSGRVYFANYLKWMDDDIIEFFRSRGITFLNSQKTLVDSEIVEGAFVIGEFGCRIHAPSKFDDVIKVRSRVVEVRTKVLKFESEVFDVNTGQKLASGSITFIWVKGVSSAPIPEQILRRLQS
jgi:acyl-CoA thioester hydrolase